MLALLFLLFADYDPACHARPSCQASAEAAADLTAGRSEKCATTSIMDVNGNVQHNTKSTESIKAGASKSQCFGGTSVESISMPSPPLQEPVQTAGNL